ncbi:MAG: ribosomal methyltransferase RsmE [Ignavibacteria bacterium]|nr:ribosomal methyltransferase RsmE [Ignavibacteria bacterium]
MDCFYYKNLEPTTKGIILHDAESKHLRALRCDIGVRILITNGSGLTAECKIISIDKQSHELHPEKFYNNLGEPAGRIALGLGIMDSSERQEFAFEKAIEFGLTDYYPLICDFSQRKNVNIIRLEAKAIAAMKQCCRSRLPVIHPPLTIEELIRLQEFFRIVVADAEGSQFYPKSNTDSILALVGPEGGFSSNELKFLKSKKNIEFCKLAPRRLRTETAAVGIMSVITMDTSTD